MILQEQLIRIRQMMGLNEDSYAGQSVKQYIDDFKEKYKLGFNETMALLTGSLNRYNEMFYKGEFKVKSMWSAVDLIEKLLS